MESASFTFTHFWLLCGLWAGIGGGIYTWFILTRERNAEAFPKERAFRFSRNYALALFLPSVVLWQLQLSLPNQTGPLFTGWASPQKDIATTLTIVCWAALVGWVNFQGGAKALSELFRATNPNQPEAFTSEGAMRVFSILVVVAGSYGLWAGGNAT